MIERLERSPITIFYKDGATSPAIVTKTYAHKWYVVGAHFGTFLYQDQYLFDPTFDDDTPMWFDISLITPEHLDIAKVHSIRLTDHSNL